jgi:PAS domain S-box-containing protein
MAKILIVEDERIAAEDIANSLEGQGHSVAGIADTGEGAIDRAEKTQPDLVLVDIQLHGQIDGIAVARHLKQEFGTPIVYLTAHADADTVERAKQTAPYAYMLKPFDDRTLQTTIEMVLERARAEGLLKQQAVWLSSLVGSIKAAIVATDESGKVRLMNPAAAALTACEKWSGVSLKNCLRLVHVDTLRRLNFSFSEVLTQNRAADFPPGAAVLGRDGKATAVEGGAAPWRAHPEGSGLVVVFRDVSEQRRAERELQRVQRLESLGLLAGGVAHDFNNMLQTILASATLASALSPEHSRVWDLLHDIEQQVERATGLTRQLLTFARGGAPILKRTSVEGLVRSSTEFSLRGSSVRPTFAIDSELWGVEVDEGQIAQVLTNLVLNARDAMNGRGELKVHARNLDLRAARGVLQPGRWVEIAVADHGVGIPRDKQDKIFEPYFTMKPQGVGLGLSSAHSIVRRHGGELRLESEPDRGSTFYVYLPAAGSASDSPSTAPPPESGPQRSLHVLVMDDEEPLRRLIADCLDEMGHHAVTARDGAEAVDEYRRALRSGRRFDIVLLDLTVRGGMGGEQALEVLRAMDPDVCAIASSGYSESAVLSEYAAHGFRGVLEKPYRFAMLARALREALPHNQADAPART